MSDKKGSNSYATTVVILLLWTMAGTGCETVHYPIAYAKDYPSVQQRNLDKPAVVLQVEDAIPEEEFKKAQDFLGEDTQSFLWDIFFPVTKTAIYSADQPRNQLVSAVLQEQFSAAGLPALDLSGQKPGQFGEGAREALSLSVRIKKLKVSTSLSTLVPLLIVTFVRFDDEQVDVVLDCQVTQPGNPTPLWKGTVSGKAESEELKKMERTARAKVNDSNAWMVHEAIDRAVRDFVNQSQVVQVSVRLRNETFAKAMKTAQDTEAGGNLRAALSQYGRAYRVAGDGKQSLAVIQTVAEAVRKLPNRPELPEDARRYGVQAASLVQNKKYTEAISTYDQALDVAPWWPEGHFNRALLAAQESRFAEAITSMKSYLALAANGSDARAAQDKVYEWELKAK
ncbi:MAG: hypothetical protein E8D45_01800 [Nitrospira sp.]|nr:MAG: hypothetical protein E8D45_01800 [Nitrospira sp.]